MPQDADPPRTLPVSSSESDVVEQRMYAEAYDGMLPHPRHLREFEELHPGITERLLTLVERQAAHRQALEQRELTMESRNSMCGLIFGLVIGLSTIVGAVVCILSGYAFSGTFLGTAGLTSLVGVFVYGSRQRRRIDEPASDAS